MRWLMLVLIASVLMGGGPALAQKPALGSVSFANSGAAAAQAPFLRGLALLHNFEYGDAAKAFREAEGIDPGFAMAFWGEAMTYNHAVWMEQDADAARAALTRLAPTPQARAALARTPREAAYLHAVETLYGAGSKADRDFRYADEMAEIHRRFPTDIDATAFYALSLLGTAHQGRDFTIYMRSAAILEAVFPEHKDHPGVLHYLIHSYDDPVHAPLGMRAASLYGALAPNAGHALHMTSHIFVALGLWDEVIDANQQAMRVVQAREAGSGKPTPGCGHYAEWLVYANLQEGRLAEADRWIGLCRTEALGQLAGETVQPALEPRRSFVASYAEMLARRAVDTGRWTGGEALPLAPGAHLTTRFNLAYGEAMGSMGDRARLSRLAPEIVKLRQDLAAAHPPHGTEAASPEDRWQDIMANQVVAADQMAQGRTAEGLAMLRGLNQREADAPIEFGPPAAYKPSAELLADGLLAEGEAGQAVELYKLALSRTPGRSRAMQGLLKAQRALGDPAGAAVTEAALARYPRPVAVE